MTQPPDGDGASIDVLMATYNGERFVAEQIESILRQSHPDWKLTVRDEVGPDGRVSFASLGVVTHDEPLGPRPVVAVAVPGADARDGIVERGWSGHDARDRAPIRRPLRAAGLPVSLRSAVPLPRPSAYGRATVPQSSGAVTRAVPVTVGVTSVTRTRSPGSAMRTSALTSTVPPGGTVTHSTSTG